MENKNYVVVEQGKKYEYNNIEEIVKSILGENYYKLNKLLNEKMFLLSLIKNKDIVVFEKESNKILTKNIDTTKLRKISGEYIVVNDCIDQILKDEISKNI